MDGVNNYIAEVETLIAKHKTTKDDLCLLNKSFEESKTSLDLLSRNLGEDSESKGAIAILQSIVDKQSKIVHTKANELRDLEQTILNHKTMCVSILGKLLDIAQKMAVSEEKLANMEEKDDVPESMVIIGKCAKFIYNKDDNHDLRSLPGVCGGKVSNESFTFPVAPSSASKATKFVYF